MIPFALSFKRWIFLLWFQKKDAHAKGRIGRKWWWIRFAFLPDWQNYGFRWVRITIHPSARAQKPVLTDRLLGSWHAWVKWVGKLKHFLEIDLFFVSFEAAVSIESVRSCSGCTRNQTDARCAGFTSPMLNLLQQCSSNTLSLVFAWYRYTHNVF